MSKRSRRSTATGRRRSPSSRRRPPAPPRIRDLEGGPCQVRLRRLDQRSGRRRYLTRVSIQPEGHGPVARRPEVNALRSSANSQRTKWFRELLRGAHISPVHIDQREYGLDAYVEPAAIERIRLGERGPAAVGIVRRRCLPTTLRIGAVGTTSLTWSVKGT